MERADGIDAILLCLFILCAFWLLGMFNRKTHREDWGSFREDYKNYVIAYYRSVIRRVQSVCGKAIVAYVLFYIAAKVVGIL